MAGYFAVAYNESMLRKLPLVFSPQPEGGFTVTSPVLPELITEGDTLDEASAVAAYERHNAHVRATAPPDRLLEWHPGDGWEPICSALGVDVPGEPFPHVNTTEEFRAMLGLDGGAG